MRRTDSLEKALIKKRKEKKRPWCWEKLKAGGKGDIEDEMVGWHHLLNGYEFG